MKEYEARETQRTLLPLLPVAVRIDGRAFHTFTRGCDKPFDAELAQAFHHTTKVLVEETNAVLGYTQSDEISLLLYQDDPKAQLFFGRKIYKLTSILASIATAAFNQARLATSKEGKELWGVKMATFDCRVWQLPSKLEAVNMFLWREKDALRNSVSAAAQAVFSHGELQGKTKAEMHEMLFQKGINWANYPKWAKSGAYFRRREIERTLTPEELERIPVKYRPAENAKVIRTDIVEWPYELGKIANKVQALFEDEQPIFLRNDDTVSTVVEG